MHEFHNFKGFKEARIDLFKPLTVLIGPNGSGKSNLIEGVELLSFLGRGGRIHDITDIGRGNRGLEIRGGLQACPKYFSDRFYLTFSLNYPINNVFGTKCIYGIGLQTKPEPRVFIERLFFEDGEAIFRADAKKEFSQSSDILVEYNTFTGEENQPKTPVSNSRSILSQYESFAKNNTKYNACGEIVSFIMQYLKQSFVFDPRPKLMRTYERISNSILTRDGSNLSAVLFRLDNGSQEEKQSLERLLGWIRHLPGEPYTGFKFVTTELDDVIFGLKIGDDGQFMDARVLSDGTLRCLSVLTALETAEPGSRVVIEEFDNGLHPSRVHILLQAMKSCCERRKLNVLVTTHNPATLNALDDDQMQGVVFCYWDKESKSSKLVSFKDLPRHDVLMESGRLGDLVTRQVVDQYFAKDFEEKYKEKALSWLENLP
ncbi:SMC domain protein [Desulfatibacillum aliphaticivorans]|uniref:SMC domain protein n=1 Tax=Desulfatibacillum aliphaticivorans TaxID=218208 RepID=B8FKK8_DESAL|nr:ATP-binding protein [Desulfatibacillum aliphaticivorans]ACL01823.1 SMC domain protein [Desulfatibacillum aliphaticivorans]